jgi:hypothetical protein
MSWVLEASRAYHFQVNPFHAVENFESLKLKATSAAMGA